MPAIAAAVEARLEKQRVGLMREWLFACLLPSMFVSLPWLGDDNGDEETPLFVQVLSLDPKVTTAQVFSEHADDCNNLGAAMAVQCYERWAPVSNNPAALGGTAEVFLFFGAEQA